MIRSEGIQAEKQGKLTKKQLNLIYEQGWFKLFVPAVYGGKQMSLPDAMQIEEALAFADGSMGWVVTLCAGAGWFGGFLDPVMAKKLLSDERSCLAGSGGIGKAEDQNGVYVVKGKWPYATGALDATAFTANCIITQNDIPEKNASGNNRTASFVFLKDEVKVLPTWNAMGMQATGSNSFEVNDLFIPAERAFEIGRHIEIDTPLYNYPFHQFAEANLSINLCGMALNFIDMCEMLFLEKKVYNSRPVLKDDFDAYKQKLQMVRQKLYYAVDMSWQTCVANKNISPTILYKVSAAAFALTKVVREGTNALYQYCGLDAADRDSSINRVFRNINTAGQHAMLVGDGSL